MNKQSGLVMAAAAMAFLILSCTGDKHTYRSIYENPVRQLENYSFNGESSLADRLNVSEEMVLQYLRDMDGNPGYSIYNPSGEEILQLEEYYALLPPVLRTVMREHLAGIYFVSGFYGSGLTDFVFSPDGEIFTILIINPAVFAKSLSQLFTYKDRSCFSNDNRDIDLTISISDEYTGFLYILLHEAAHILDYVEIRTPYVMPLMKDLGYSRENDKPFSSSVWEEYGTPVESLSFPLAGQLKFYTESDSAKMPIDQIADVYGELKNSPFASLYSMTSWAEDFAEFVTLYHLTQNLGLEYRIVISREANSIFEYEPFKNGSVLNRALFYDFLH